MTTHCLSGNWPQRALNVISSIRDDLEADCVRREGQPFTGRNVAEQFGELAAAVDALAHIVGDLIERTEADK